MRTFSFLLFCCGLSLTGCAQPPAPPQAAPAGAPVLLHPSGKTLDMRFAPPAGYRRTPAPAGTYAAFLRGTKLKQDGAPVLYYDGRVKPNPNIYAAVADFDIGSKDLQQCADAVMRLRAEYLFGAGRPESIHFNFTNGFRADFSRWAAGYRPRFSGRQTTWVKATAPAADYQSLRRYLDLVFSYAGTLSLSRELQPVPLKDMQIGDVLIIGGSPGHAVTVMDMAVNDRGEKVFLLSQGYMPAQDIQILHNPAEPGISPWYRLRPDIELLETPEWTFTRDQLKRFPAP